MVVDRAQNCGGGSQTSASVLIRGASTVVEQNDFECSLSWPYGLQRGGHTTKWTSDSQPPREHAKVSEIQIVSVHYAPGLLYQQMANDGVLSEQEQKEKSELS